MQRRSTLSTSAHISTSSSSYILCGASISLSSSPMTSSGEGRAARSTFPFLVIGISSITTITPGTMYSGNRPLTCLLISSLTSSSSSPSRFTSTLSLSLSSSFLTAYRLYRSVPSNFSSCSTSTLYPLLSISFLNRSFLPSLSPPSRSCNSITTCSIFPQSSSSIPLNTSS